MVELKNVSAAYEGRPVLQDVSAVLEQGSLTALIGVNGCGKSTLLKTVLRMMPCGGTVLLDGTPLTELSRQDMAKKLAYLPQSRSTPDMTVEQLVLHGRFPHLHYPRRYSSQDRQLAREAMAHVGLEDCGHMTLDTLSGGMRQNAYIAMALAQTTEHILLDEPTTYLDIGHQLALLQLLRQLAEGGKGILAVMHDLPMAFTFAHRILLLHEGRILADGAPEDLWDRDCLRQVFGVALEPSADGRSYHYRYE